MGTGSSVYGSLLENERRILGEREEMLFEALNARSALKNQDGVKVVDIENLQQNAQAHFWVLKYSARECIDCSLAMSVLRGDDGVLPHIDLADATGNSFECGNFALNAECAELQNLDPIVPFLMGNSTKGQCVILNISNNSIPTEEFLDKQTFIRQSSLQALSIGGNPIPELSIISNLLPQSLVCLDLSYCDGISVNKGSFHSLFQILRLILDGCGISSTSTSADGASIFSGLVSLEELSLKENNLESKTSLQGLKYFGFAGFVPLSEDIAMTFFGSIDYSLRPSCLKHLHIAENPLCETSALHKETVAQLLLDIPSLETLDEKPLRSRESTGVPQVQLTRADTGRSSAMVGISAAGLDNMEQEYLAALKGEKDSSVIS